MKLHLPKMLATALLAAISSISAYADVPHTGTVYTWDNTTSGTDPAFGRYAETTYDGDTPTVTENVIAGQSGNWGNVQNIFAKATLTTCNTMRFDSTHGQNVKTLNYTFTPFTVGGFIVEEGATGFSINSGGAYDRAFFLGNNSEDAAYSYIHEDFAVNKTSGSNNFTLRGTQTFAIDSGKTFTLKSNNGFALSGHLTTTGTGTLDLATGDISVASGTVLTFGSNVNIGGKLSLNATGLTAGGDPLLTLTSTGTLNIGNFEITGTGTLADGTYSIVSTSNEVADTLLGFWSDTEELKLANDGGTLKLTVKAGTDPIEITTNTDLLYTNETTRGYHISGGATLGINNGSGGKGGAAAGSSYNYGPITVEGEGSKLSVWHWTNSVATLNTTDKVSIASPITVKDGGIIFMEDGSYYFAGGVNVDGSGSIQMQWAKGALLDCLNSEEGTTDNEFTFTAFGYDPDDRTQLYGIVNDGNFDGTVKLDTRDAGPLHFALSSENALKNAVLDLGDGTRNNILALNTAATNMKGIQGKGTIKLATNLGGNAGITESTLNLTGAGSTFSGTVGEGVTLAVAKGADLTLSGTLGLYKPFDVSGTLTLSSDLVIDLTHLAYEEKEGAHVYTFAKLAEDATYTGYDALSKASVKGVTAESVTFKNDGTIVLTTEAPHAVTWDPNWGVTGPDVLSAALTANTALVTSPYKTGDDVTVELTGAGNPDAYIYGGQNSDVNNTGATYAANVWINAKEGSYKAIVGGNYCNNWGGGGTLNFAGDTHIQIDGATVGTIVGGNLKDGKTPKFTGSSYISVVSGDVTASIVGASTNSHKEATTFTGDTHIFIYVPLATDSGNPLPDEGNYTAVPKNHVIGGISHMHNVAGTGTLDGSTNITIDLSKYAGGTSTFVKTVVGGSQSDLEAHTQSITGDTNVTIKGGSIEFSGDIIAGNRNHNGSSTIGGGSTLSIEDGTYSGTITGGSKITASASSAIGDVVVNLGGAAQINGNVYAAGVVDGAGTGGSTVASTTVNLGADVTFGTTTLSGGFGGASATRGSVTNGSVLNLTDAKEYTHLSTVTLDAFDEISVAKDGSATVSALTNSPLLTKSGEGALTLALGGESAIMDVEVAAGTLTLDAADMEIMGITVDSGATLAAAAGSSLQAAAITLSGGSTLSVGAEGLVLAEGSYLIMDDGKVGITATGTPGQEIVLVTGLTEDDSITGITFDKTDESGNKYADSSTYLTLGTTLADYTQLKLKDGKLVLAKASGGGNYWGKGKGDGTWDLSTENWAKDDGLDASGKFTDNAAAYFTANGGGGTITVGEAINVTTINVSGAAYNFTGGQNLNITGGISVTDSGSATFDKVAGELKNVYIAGTESKLTIKNGDVIVNALSNEGTFIVDFGDSLTVKNATAMGGNVTAKNLILTGENTFGTVKVSGTVSGAMSIKLGGESRITKLSGVNKLTLTDGKLTLGSTVTELKETTLSGALETGAGVGLGSLTMNDGSSITGHGAVSASGITVSGGTATIQGTTDLQTASVGGSGTLKVNSGNTVSGSNINVTGTLDMQEGSTLANEGTLSVAGKVIAGNGINLGTVAATGTVEVNGASVSATGGSIATLDIGTGETLAVTNDLALTSTTGTAGTLSAGGKLTVNGNAALQNVAAGSLELATTGTLTATGTLDAASITLTRVSKTDCYLTAGVLDTTATNFVVDKALIEALDASVGSIITLANLDTDYTGAVTINGTGSFSDKNRHVYTIMKDAATHDIVLTVDQQESGFVWYGSEDTLWSTAGNWSGLIVPGSEDWVQVKNDTHPHTIELDQDANASYFSVSAQDATLKGGYTLDIGSALEVNANGLLYVGDGAAPTTIETPTATINGTLVVQPRSAVQADATVIDGGTLNVNDATYIAETIDMTDGALRTSLDSFVTTGQLNGDINSIVGGHVIITGTGSRYTGEYDVAYIDIDDDADATLYAGDGLTLGGDGTAKLQYSGSTAIDGIDADELIIILNDPTASSIGSTLTLQETSWLEEGSVEFGMSAIESARTLGAGAPAILLGDLQLGEDASVVVNQDKTADSGLAMEVRNGGYTAGLQLARFGGAETDTENVTLNGYLYEKYYTNARIEGGKLLVDMRQDFYRTVSGAHSPNGQAGAEMLDAAFVELNPQFYNPTGDLAAVMTALETGAVAGEAADKALAAMSGSSIAALGAAFGSDVDRQLRAIRNRTTSMGLNDCLVSEDLPYFNAWVNAEGDYRRLTADGTLAGYKLSSWGGTVGFDVDCTPRFTCGLALTAMQGNFTANSTDAAEGDLDRMYVSAFARYTRRSLTQTLVGTFGRADTKLRRTVDYGAGAYRTEGDSDGTAFGVMYEIGYAKALNEDATTCIQPVLNLSYRHSSIGGYSEKGGSDAALTADDAEMNVFTAAVGARLQSVVGTSVYNRASLFEGRVLVKMDSGDRDVAVRNRFLGARNGAEAKSTEVGAFGIEVGAGITLPIAEDGGSLFFDVTGEFRSHYSEVNGTAGYRFNF